MKNTPQFRLIVNAALTFAALLPGLTSRAESIGGSFGGGNAGNQALAPTDVAGYGMYAQANYNLLTGPSTNLPLKNQNGAATTVTLTTTGANDYSAIAPAASGPDEILNNDRTRALSGGWSFTLSNIPYESYTVIVYDMQLGLGTEAGISLNDTTYYTSSPQYNASGYLDNNAATPFTYTQGTSTDFDTPTPDSDFVIFPGITGSTALISISSGRLSGFQIVETAVPEPSTWAALLLGGAILGGVACRRRLLI